MRRAIPAWFSTYGHQAEDPPAFPRLGEPAVPCVLVLGERDMPEVVCCNEEMAARIPGCTLVRLPACDHLPTLRALRAPETVRRLVLELAARVA
ncbi:alpha/beta hydrolase [Streptomyces sp. NPDC046931]|uniref:alpha/beta fold hydrolase n=1 Tax=Streptomyces sp. NPDC046931 TaxID=3154806 RepID=UPI003408BC5B